MKIKKKHRRSLLITSVAYLFLFSSSVPWSPVWGAASGNYTDLLPIGAAGNTTVISNGTGWSLTTLAPSQTFGDALSRAPMVVYQSSSPVTISNTAAGVQSTFTVVGTAGHVGSATFPAAWVATGRTIRITIKGRYTTVNLPTWNWKIRLGDTNILQTGAVSAPVNATTNEWFSAVALLTVGTTGASGTVNGTYDIMVGSTGATSLSYSTTTFSATSVDWTTKLTVNPTLAWGTQATGNSVIANNVTIEFLN